MDEITQNEDNSHKALSNLTYFDAVIKETLRYYGPGNALFIRIATKNHYLKDIYVQKGTSVTIVAHSIHRNPKYYKEPHVYDPERWLENPN